MRKQMTTRYFDAGHMMYHHSPDRKKLHDAIAELVRGNATVTTKPAN